MLCLAAAGIYKDERLGTIRSLPAKQLASVSELIQNAHYNFGVVLVFVA